MVFTYQYEYPWGKIYADAFLHLKFDRTKFLGAQSWVSSHLFCVELYFSEGDSILLEYDTQEKWVQILQLIEKI